MKKKNHFRLTSSGGSAEQSQRISLIGQRKDQVRFQLPAVLVTVQHGQTVEQMSCIDHQGQQNGRKKVVRCKKQRNCNKLHGASVNEQAHKKCPAHMEAGTAGENAESNSQENVSYKDRKRKTETPPGMPFVS